MADNNSTNGKVAGNLKPLMAKVQAMTILADAGVGVCNVGTMNVLKGDAQEALKAIAVGLEMMCDDLKNEINKAVAEYGSEPIIKEGEEVRDILKKFLDHIDKEEE